MNENRGIAGALLEKKAEIETLKSTAASMDKAYESASARIKELEQALIDSSKMAKE